MKIERVYVAGALTSKEKKDRTPSQVVVDYLANVNAMCKAASTLRKLGYYPYVPALDFMLGMVNGDWTEDMYRDIGMSFLEVCDAVFVISDSWGVQQEIARAHIKHIPVFKSLIELQIGQLQAGKK